jgi:hypothetical protein
MRTTSPITNIKTSLNAKFRKLRNVATSSWIVQVHQQHIGSFALNTEYAVYILNQFSSPTLQQKMPLEVVFHWYQPVYFVQPNRTIHLKQKKDQAVFLVSPNIKEMPSHCSSLIMDDITHRVVPRSELRPHDPLLPFT